MRPNKEAVKVVIRMRPLLAPFEDEEIWAVNEKRTNIYTTKSLRDVETPRSRKDIRRRYAENISPQNFTFDHVYGPEVRTSQIYQQIGRPVIQSVLNGYNGTMFMYGQTTSGKTYSMLGTPDLPGVLPCAIKHLFQSIEQDTEFDYQVWVSYVEIYNEQINDLLIPGNNNLQVKEDPLHGVAIKDLKQQQVYNFNQVIILMNYGEEHRSYRETDVHEHSSRSHTLFQVYVEAKRKEPENGRVRYSVLNLVDLAGSERLNEFEVRAHGQMAETGHINRSLFILSNVVNKLAEGRGGHIPYRDSSLTRILSNALGGNSCSTIICTVSPAAMNFHLTLSTLRFACRAKTVQNKPQVNELLDEVATLNQFKAEIIRTKEELRIAQTDLSTSNKKNQELMRNLQEVHSGTSEISHELGELRLTRDRDRQRIIELESRLMATNERADTVQYANMHAQQEAGRNLSQPENFLSDILFTIDSEIPLTPENQKAWVDETVKLNNSYQYELKQLQDSYLQSLAQVSSDVIPEHTEAISNILGIQGSPQRTSAQSASPGRVDYFQGVVDDDFGPILDEYLRSGQTSSDFADVIVNRLKDKHDQSSAELDQHYRELQQQGVDVNELANAYDTAAADLERKYVEALQQLDEYLGFVDEEEEEVALQEYPVPIAQRSPAQSAAPNRSNIGQAMYAYLWGSGKDGRCGTGSEEGISHPSPLFQDKNQALNIQKLACGYHHSAAITEKGALYTWGRGIFGQLGHGNNDSYTVPVKINALSSHIITEIACGWQHTAAVSNQGLVFTWGYGEDGQLGHGDGQDYAQPKVIEALEGCAVSKVACGHSHSGCISAGRLFMWGCNPDCRLFIDSTESKMNPTQVPLPGDVIELSLGVSHSAAITGSGELYTSGLGQEGQLGYPCDSYTHQHRVEGFDRANPAIRTSCGDCYTLVLTKSHQVFAFGKGAHGRLGVGDEDNHYEPTHISTLDNEEIVEICAGCRHAGAVSLSGSLFTWGFNFYEQLGIGEGDRDFNTPTRVENIGQVKKIAFGYFHSGVLSSD